MMNNMELKKKKCDILCIKPTDSIKDYFVSINGELDLCSEVMVAYIQKWVDGEIEFSDFADNKGKIKPKEVYNLISNAGYFNGVEEVEKEGITEILTDTMESLQKRFDNNKPLSISNGIRGDEFSVDSILQKIFIVYPEKMKKLRK